MTRSIVIWFSQDTLFQKNALVLELLVDDIEEKMHVAAILDKLTQSIHYVESFYIRRKNDKNLFMTNITI